MLLLLRFSPVQTRAPAAARSPPLGAVAAAVLVAVAAVAAVGHEADGAVLTVEGRVRPVFSDSGSGLSLTDFSSMNFGYSLTL